MTRVFVDVFAGSFYIIFCFFFSFFRCVSLNNISVHFTLLLLQPVANISTHLLCLAYSLSWCVRCVCVVCVCAAVIFIAAAVIHHAKKLISQSQRKFRPHAEQEMAKRTGCPLRLRLGLDGAACRVPDNFAYLSVPHFK